MSAGGGDEPDGLEVSDKKARVLPTPKTFRERWAQTTFFLFDPDSWRQ